MKQNFVIVQCYFPTLKETENYKIPDKSSVSNFGFVIAIFNIKLK